MKSVFKQWVNPKAVLLVCLLSFYFVIQAQVNADGTIDTGDIYADSALINNETPEQIAKRLEWWNEARFGMFIHWGLYAQDGCFWKGQYGRSEHMMLKLEIPIIEYGKIADVFNPVDFNADEWVSIAKNAGMKYMVITSKHHDGFAMFDSPSNDFNIVKHTPWKRDPIKELAVACEKQEIKFGVYYSLGRDWHDPNCNSIGGRRSNLWDYPNEEGKVFSDYFEGKVKPQIKELLNQYKPAIIWFDTPELITLEQSKELLKLIHDIDPNCIVNQRIGNRLGDYSVREQKIPETGDVKPWESCMTLNHTWGYNKIDHEWKSADTLIRSLIDISSKGGNFLLNVGPTGEGIIPIPSVERLKEVGDWLNVNGEAIYGAKASGYVQPAWGRYTLKKGVVYAHVFDWPENRLLLINKNIKIDNATLLANPNLKLKIKGTKNGVAIKLPKEIVDSSATVIKIVLRKDEDWANLKKYKKANELLRMPSKDENRVVFMGNSITERWNTYDSSFFQSNPYINRGISGQTTAQMLIRFRPDVIDLQPKVVVIHGGTNDIAGNRGPQTVEQIAGNIFSMAELAQVNNIKVILAALLPAISYSWRPGVEPADKIIALNQLIEAYAKKNKLLYLDYYSPMVNEQKGLKKEYGRDTVHPSITGYKVMESLVEKAIQEALKK